MPLVTPVKNQMAEKELLCREELEEMFSRLSTPISRQQVLTQTNTEVTCSIQAPSAFFSQSLPDEPLKPEE